MYIQTVTFVCLRGDESRRAEELMEWIDSHTRDLALDTEEREEAKRLFNRVIHRERKYEEDSVKKLVSLLKRTRGVIAKKRQEMQEMKLVVPSHMPDSSIILRPKEFVQALIDNYSFQMRAAEELVQIFEKESFEE